jgi:uncharacterized membrane protein HdeD (DUF308 family)
MNLQALVHSEKPRVIRIQSGVAAILGALLLFMPALTGRGIVFLLAVFVIAQGGSTLLSRKGELSTAGKTAGWLAIVAGFATLLFPKILGVPLIFLLAALALAHGVMNLATLPKALRAGQKRIALWTGLSAAISIAFAIWIFGSIGSTVSGLVRWMGLFALAYGYALLGLGFELERGREAATREGAPRESKAA